MPEKQHWPFGTEADAEQHRDAEQERLQREKVQDARRRTRFDRLLVGGRAHSKKRGLN